MQIFNVLTDRNGVAQVYLYGFVGEGERVDAANVVAQLLEIENKYSAIDIHINSNGGDVFNGFAIYNALKQSTAKITIYVDGIAASIASIIALCGKPLYMSPYARLMLHAVKGGAYGNSSELKKTAKMIEDIQHDLAQMVAKRCKMDADAVYQTYFADEKDHWLSAQEALDMGIIDGISKVEDVEDAPEPNASAEAIQQYFSNRLHGETLKINKDMAFFDNVKAIGAFSNATDENAALDMIKGMVGKASLVDSLQKENQSLKDQIAQMNDKADEALINQAIQDGKISEAQKASFMNLMKSDRENTVKLINSFEKPKPRQAERAAGVFQNEGGDTFANKTWDELDKSGQLINLKNSNIELFKNKFKEKFGVDYQE